MNKIQYHYTNLAKQIFFLVCFLYFFLRFLIMMEIIFFRIDGYYESTNIPLTLLLYAALFTIVILFFRGHKFCFSTYDEDHLIYHNTLLRTEKKLELADAKLAVLDTFGIKFFSAQNADPKTEKPIFFLPFFRDGIIEAVQIDKFYKMLKAKEDIRVVKKFKVLPGYSNKWKFVTIAYGFLAVILFMSCATPITVVIVLFQNH